MTSTYPNLFSPLRVGPATLRNRIMVPPHQVSFTPGYGDGFQRVIDYYVERAKGGAAMVTMSNYVMPRSWWDLGRWGGRLETSSLGSLTLASDPAMLPVYARLARGVQDHGAVFVAQLNAGGRQHFVTGAQQFGLPLMAPSALPCPRTHQIPKAMDHTDIADLIESLVTGAQHMREAGADGVELFAAQGYLLSEFLSPHTNQRDDEYGGSLENRLRVVIEALQAMRAAAGHDFIVGLRMNGADHSPGGLTLDDSFEMARRLHATGLLDYLNVSGMTYMQHPGWIADITAPEALFASDAARLRTAVPGLPVCVAARIGTPDVAEHVVATGQADLVGMVRALIADPEWPLKARRGDVDDIRQCTYSNQSCLMSLAQGRGVGCMQNTAVGREAQLGIGTMRRAEASRRVVVVGGGPAGMAAARIAAERGHRVTLLEAASALGGQNLMTAQIASRRGFGEVTRWQAQRLHRLGVDIHLGLAADAAAVLSFSPDAVVLATGSRPRRDGWSTFRPDVPVLAGADQPHVLSVWEVFSQPGRIGASVLLVDEDPHLCGVFVAEHLAMQGRRVQIATPHLHPGAELHVNFAGEIYERLVPLNVVIHPHQLVVRIDGPAVTLCDRYGAREQTLECIDTVVLAMGQVAYNPLAGALAGLVDRLQVVGDCLAPRRIDEAIVDGERVGWSV